MAEAIVNVMYPDGRRVAFADALKREVWDAFRISKGDPGGREKLIEYGEEKRNADRLYWIRQMEFTIDHLWPPDAYVPVIDDVRFRTELDWCRERGFYVVRVDAPTQDRIGRLRSDRQDLEVVHSRHPGETELDGAEFDFRWLNGGWDSCVVQCVAEKVVRRAKGLVPS